MHPNFETDQFIHSRLTWHLRLNRCSITRGLQRKSLQPLRNKIAEGGPKGLFKPLCPRFFRLSSALAQLKIQPIL